MSYTSSGDRAAVSLAILTLLLLIHLPAAGNEDGAEFQRAYRAYQKHLAANETGQALVSASRAYKLGSALYGRRSLNAAKLAINYSVLLNDAGDFKKARKVLKGRLKILENQYGANAAELVAIHMELGRAEFDPGKPEKALKHFSRTAGLLEDHENPLYRARKNFDIAVTLLQRNGKAFIQEYIEAAHTIYARELQANDFRLGLTSYHMAARAFAQQQYEQAVEYLKVSLGAFKTDDGALGDLEVTVRLQLVESLENLHQSELATEHCLALGSKWEWTTPVAPLFTKEPVVPPHVAQAGLTGEVTLEFAVDERGYVVNPRVAASTEEAFDTAALDMIRQFRYAPRFVDGEPVLTDGVDYTIRFGVAEAIPAQEQGLREFRKGFDGFGRPDTRWRFEQNARPDFDPVAGSGNKN